MSEEPDQDQPPQLPMREATSCAVTAISLVSVALLAGSILAGAGLS